MPFIYQALPARVVFGAGAVARIEEELVRLGVKRALVLSTPGRAGDAERMMRDWVPGAAALFAGARMHTPVEVTQDAMQVLREAGADGLLAIGGGSTIGLAKALALRTGLPQLVVPSTFAGSEMTPIIGQTEGGVKTTQNTPDVLPETVIYDPDLLADLPPKVAGPSGMNAIAHSVEGLYAKEANPITALMAEESIRRLGNALPRLMTGGAAADWSDALYGACLAGIVLGTVGPALHHKICHILGGTFDLNHADIHCLMIPYAAAYNAAAAPEAMAAIARALGAEDALLALYELMRLTANKTSLKAFGLSEADLDRVAQMAVDKPYYNPAPITVEGVRAMLQQAFDGSPPRPL